MSKDKLAQVLAVKPKAEKPKLTPVELLTSLRKVLVMHEKAAQTIEGGLGTFAGEMLARTVWVWAQGDNMTREAFLEAAGEAFDKTKELLDKHLAAQQQP
jgi:hypothetical protein